MTTIIQNWVCDKTGVSINLEGKGVGKQLYDGLIYFKLIKFMTPGKGNVKQPKFPVYSPFEALSNLEILCPWLKILGVNHSVPFLKKISQGDNEACLRMLYEIYLRVEDRNHIYMVTKQREAYLLSKEENRFQVKKAPEINTGFVDTNYCKSRLLEDPLVHNKTLVLKYKYRKEKLLKKCKQERSRRTRKLALLDNPISARSFQTRVNLTPPTPHTEHCIKRCESKKHVIQTPEQMYLFQKKKRTLNIEKTKMKMFASVLQDLWSAFISNEREDFENIVRSKLLKQSYQEKQLSIRWTQLHTQYKNFFQQSIVTNEQTDRSEPILADTYPYKKVDEKKRLLELHCRLFDEVVFNIEKEKLSLCSQTVADLVDYAILKSEYWRAHEHDVPMYVKFLWKELFYKGWPIELEVNNHFKIESSYNGDEDIKMHNLQTKIPDALLDVIVDCYLKKEGLWSTSNECRPLNHFGFIIHSLLYKKYPLPPDLQPLKLPDFTTKVILADVHDPFIFRQLEQLLEVHNVALIDVNLFTNYCLEKFEQEKYYDQHNADYMKKFSDIVELEGFISMYRNVMNKGTQFPPTDSGKPKHSFAGFLGQVAFETLNEGESLDDVLLVAMLGEYLKTLEGKRGFVLAGYPTTLYQILMFEYFIMGKPLKVDIKKSDPNMQQPVNSSILLYLDNLVRRCISRKQSEGEFSSSMIDYINESAEEEESEMRTNPEDTEEQRSYSQVNPSESSKQDKSYITSFSEKVTYSAPDQPWTYADSNQFRNSKILPNPIAEWPSKNGISQTYVERYITICKGNTYVKSDRNIRTNENKTTLDYKKCKTPSQKTNYINQNAKGEQIYEQFDKLTKIYIWEFDVETIAFISKIILDVDADLPTKEIKQSIVSFGRLITQAKEIDNTAKPKKDGLCKDIQYIPSPAYYDYKSFTKHPHFGKLTEVGTFANNFETVTSDSQGYIEQPIPEKLQMVMASVWEQVENSYLKKLRQSLSKVLSVKSQWLPFRNYVSQMSAQCIERVDERLQIVNNFQLMFNEVELFTRKTPKVKAELHYKVKELNNTLLKLIDTKRSKALDVKNDLEDTQWIRNYTLLLTNSYLRLLQHEMDRTVDSLQIIIDYYTSMLGLIPDTKILPKIEIKPILLEEEDHVVGKKKSKSYSMSLKRSTSSANEPSSGSCHVLSSGLNAVRGKIKSLQSFLSTIINGEKKQTNVDKKPPKARSSSIGNEHKKLSTQSIGKEAKAASSKKLKSVMTAKSTKKISRSKTLFGSSKSLKAIASVYEPSRNESRLSNKMKSTKRGNSEELQLKENIKTEWQNVVRMEMERLLDIVALIEEKANTDIESAIQNVNYLYEKFELDIEESYQKERKALNNIKNIFSAAIEDEVPIQPLLVFDNDTFFIDKSNLLFPDSPPDPPVSIEEETDNYNFQIGQLEKLVVRLQSLSPNRIILKTLGFVLYDHFKSSEVPAYWKKLSKKRIDEILSFVYGRVDVVDWRVFVLYATNIPFPTLEDLLYLKMHFEEIDQEKTEIISKEQFFDTTLWFDREFTTTLEGDLHLSLSKLLIERVFEVSNSELNYTEFLLLFCKSETNKEGFMKILQMLNDKDDLRKTDCAVHEVVPVDAIIVAKQEFDRILSNAFNVMDDIEVKKLPTDHYENIFATRYNEYLNTEMILANNFLASPRTRASQCYEIDPQFEKHMQSFEEYKNCLPLYERFQEPIWYKCIHYKLALTICMFALNLNFPSPDGAERQLYVETRLKDLFKEKGVNNYIQAFHLYESKFMQEIFETSFFFKTCRLDELLKKFINDTSSHSK